MSRIKELAEDLARIDEEFVTAGVSQHYISVRRGPDGEIVLDANAAGMVHLAAQLLRLVSAARSGGHYHLDEAGVADSADPPLVINFKLAPWETS